MPMIKFVTKQIIADAAKNLHEFVGPIVVFSLDVFNVFYVAICMQAATSTLTTRTSLLTFDYNQIVQEAAKRKCKQPIETFEPIVTIESQAFQLNTTEQSAYDALQALFYSEYVLMGEYIEFMLPLLYALYLAVLFHLPIAAYYPHTATMTPIKLHETLFTATLRGKYSTKQRRQWRAHAALEQRAVRGDPRDPTKPAISRHPRHNRRWPFETAYEKLSWTTRQTIRSSVSLCAILYIFLTIPFRIAFYYDTGETITHHWTEELRVFAVLDAVADFIGILEFLRFYRLQKKVFGPRFASFDASKSASLQQASRRLMRSSSFSTAHRRKTEWTLASIGQSAELHGNPVDDRNAERNFVRTTKFRLVLEVVALLPVEVVPYASGTFNALHVVRITKLCRLYKLRHCLERFASIYSDRTWVQHLSSTGIASLVRNIGLCAGLCHYVACGYMLMAHAQCGVSLEACDEHVETSWAVRDRLFGASVARKYARTLYWASRTLVLLGYDDVTPVSDAETIYALAATLLGALFGSSLLATFLFIFRLRNARYAAFSTHVDNAREYMRSQNIPRAVRRQVIAYLSYAWNTHRSLDSEEALRLMPKHLQSKVVSTLKASRIKQVCFLAKESVEFINLLAAALVRRVYSPADQIIEPKFNAQMFFVIRGTVVLSSFKGSNSRECQTGDFFADSCLLSPETFLEKAVAKTFCELYVLAKSKFDDAMSGFYRNNEGEIRAGMAEALEKYTTQLRKTKKLLGARNRAVSSRRAEDPDSMTATAGSHSRRRGVGWRLPGSVFRIHWDAVRLLSIVFIAFEVPYFSVFISMTDEQQMFVEQPEFGLRYSLALVIEVLFGVDLVLRSRHFAHLDPIVMLPVEDPQLIFSAYKANGFYPDLIAWLPVGVILESLATASDQKYSWMLRLLRLLRVRKVPELLWNICDYYSISSKAHLVISLL
ncbi:hypothetical protein PInf_010340 [Phytophthora infestans]|nr:hypothetical protein PInf_010340 [Phytophthora infestans]